MQMYGRRSARASRRRFFSWICLPCILLLGTLVLTACTGGSNPSLGTGAEPGSGSVSNTAFRYWSAPWGASVSYNPYAPGYNGNAFDPARLPLAYVLPAPDKFGTYYPELATSWSTTGGQVTLHLRKAASWQDGTPFTSQDVLTSLLLAGAEQNEIWAVIDGVTLPDAQTVVLKVKSGNSPKLLLDNVMQVAILPASEYKQLAPDSLQQDLIKYWSLYQPAHPTTRSVQAAQNSQAYSVISKASAALVKFKPKHLVGNGPFKILKVTSSEIILTKWDGFWDAKKISIPYLEVLSMDSGTATGAFLAKRLDFFGQSLTTPLVERLKRDSDLHYVVIDTNVQQRGLLFNFAHYPFNLTGVRQALAYVINRKNLAELEVGGAPAQNPYVRRPAGLHEALARQFLSKSQLNSLDAYNYDLAKAEKILTGLGFSKKGGTWRTPKGNPFKFTIDTLSTSAPFEADATVIAQDLRNFGIETSTTAHPDAVFNQQQTTGQYAVSLAWVDNGTLNPLSYLTDILVTWNYPATWNGKGECKVGANKCQPAIGIGPTDSIAGLGRVNIAATLNHQYSTTPPGPEWKELTWDYARYINEKLPVLPLINNSIHEGYSSSRYADWPADSSKLWSLYGSRQILYFSQHGYLKPAK